MAIYTAHPLSFIDSYRQAATYRDQVRENEHKKMMEGIGNLAKAGVDAYKFKQRQDILDKRKQLDDEEAALTAELSKLLSSDEDYAGSKRNFDMILGGMDWNLAPKMTKGGLL